MKKRVIAWLLVFVMVFSLPMPIQAAKKTNAMEGDTNGDGVITVYFTLSEDGEFVKGNDENETQMAHIRVDMSYFDLKEYGLEKFYRYESNSFDQGGGYIGDEVIEAPTLLHLYIKMLEKYYLGDGSKLIVGDKDQDALTVSGSAQSLYMSRFWGHDENLMYFVNHKYPLQAAGWGSTSDYILLEDGMEIDVAMFTDWDFYHDGAFAQFISSNEKKDGKYEVKTGEEITLQMLGTSTNAAEGGESEFSDKPMAKESVVCENQENAVSENTNAHWNQVGTTDKDGKITLKFDKPGTYYVSSTPLYESFKMDSGNACVAPPIAVIEVTGDAPPTPAEEDYSGNLIKNLSFAAGTVADSKKYNLSKDFSVAESSYDLEIPDYKKDVSLFLEADESAPQRTKYQVSYTDTDGSEKVVELQSGTDTGKKLNKLMKEGNIGTDFTVLASCENQNQEDVTQTFKFHIVRRVTLKSLFVEQEDGTPFDIDLEFNPEQLEYEAILPVGTTDGFIVATPFSKDGYTVNSEKTSFNFNNGENEKSYTITVFAENSKETTYTIKLHKKTGISVNFVTTKGSSLQVADSKKRNICRKLLDGDSYVLENLAKGEEYSYTVTCAGFMTKSGTFSANDGQTIDIQLEKARDNSTIKNDIPSSWKNFRGNDENNGLTTAKTPTDYKDLQLYWAKKVGESYGKGAPSSPIIVDDALIYTTSTSIVKVDKLTGEVLASGEMVKASAFNITPPTYADGMIFVALASGTIQAFNADTLESLWVYHDPYYGQPNSPITYHNGYIYTGFWTGDSNKANFVCLSVTDEDINNKTEEKTATWTYTHTGGFYWAGCYANDDFVLVGTDDGCKENEDGGSKFIAFSPLTGEILDEKTGLNGDIRSTVCYDKETDRYYFTSKGGSFYQANVSHDGKITDLQEIKLEGASTSTPVVHNGRAYIGVRGAEQFGANSGHNITVIDLKSMSVAYKLTTRGYPQTSGLLTTGYENEDGYIYVYFVDNYEPGKIRVLKDKPGQTKAIITRESEYEESDDTNVLFTPKGQHANYAICSLICDEDGTLYFKNDSSYMMAIGSKVKEIKVTTKPNKVHYTEGEKFDPTGMKVVAYYANGKSKDVTTYVTYQDKALTLDRVDVEIRFPYASYNDELANYEKFDPILTQVDITVVDQNGLTAAQNVVKAIDAIKSPITMDSLKSIQAARKAYDALESSQESYVTNYQKLLKAESDYQAVLKTYWKSHKVTLTVKANDYQSINLSWTKAKSADGYEIYRATSKTGKYQKINSVSTTSCKDTKLNTGTTYYYKVKPYAKIGAWDKTVVLGDESGVVSAKPSLTAVTGVSTKVKTYNSVMVSWKKVTGANGYEIYRSTKKNSGYKKVKTITASGTIHYVDSKLKTGTTYYYKVRAYRKIGSKKVYSTAWSSVKSAKPVLATATLKQGKSSKKQAALSWKKVTGAKGYELYRSTKKSSGYKKIASISKLKYTDKKVTSKKTYYYKVRSYCKVGSKNVYSSYSKPLKVKVK